MHYRVIDHHKSPITSRFLFNLYELTSGDKESVYACIPNGGLGITIVLRGRSYIQIENQWVRQPDASVYGLIRKKQFIKISKDYREISIGFMPHYFQQFMRQSMSALLEHNATDLNLLFDKYEVEQLIESLLKKVSDDQLVEDIANFLHSNLVLNKDDNRLHAAHDLIHNSKVWNVKSVSDKLNISTVGLRNIFRDKFGMSPKEAIKIARIQKALRHSSKEEESLTQLAYDLHYFDQSHFIHDFKDAVGLTPKQYFSNKALTFDFYNYSRWQLSSFAK